MKHFKMIKKSVTSVALLMLLFVSACTNSPIRMYLLEPVQVEEEVASVSSVKDIGLSIVSLPGYADDKRIASRSNQGLVVQAYSHHWAEDPKEAITRVLADRLRKITTANVVTKPWPRGYQPQARIEISMDKLLRKSNGGVEMSGQIKIISGDGKSVKSIESFDFSQPGESTQYSAYFAAVSTSINKIANLAATAIVGGLN